MTSISLPARSRADLASDGIGSGPSGRAMRGGPATAVDHNCRPTWPRGRSGHARPSSGNRACDVFVVRLIAPRGPPA